MFCTLSAGQNHSLFIDTDFTVWACGNNFFGQLGLGDTGDRMLFYKISGVPSIRAVSAGGMHSILLDCDGSVWVCGDNEYGQLAKEGGSVTTPVKLDNLPFIKEVSAGYINSILLDENGSVWICGENDFGQLGLKPNPQEKIHRIPDLPKITTISSGYQHNLLLDENGCVWGCGFEKFGQLGQGLTHSSTVTTKPVLIPLPKIKLISAGGYHSLFLDENEKVWACGCNSSGQLGLGDVSTRNTPTLIALLPPILSFITGQNYSLFVDMDENVWACGHNANGQLGTGEGNGACLEPKKINIPTKIQFVSAGFQHSLFLDGEENLWCCGLNKYGQLGMGNVENRRTPILVPNIPKILSPFSSASAKSARNVS